MYPRLAKQERALVALGRMAAFFGFSRVRRCRGPLERQMDIRVSSRATSCHVRSNRRPTMGQVLQHELPVAHVDPAIELAPDFSEVRHLAKSELFVKRDA